MKAQKLVSVFLLGCILISACRPAPGTPNATPSISIQITGTDEVEVATENISQPNCHGNAEVDNQVQKSRSIQHTIETTNGVTVNADGQIGFAGTDVQLGATVAAQLGTTYGFTDTITRTLTVRAKPGSNMLHSIKQTEIWEIGVAKISVGDRETTIPFRFRNDFNIELASSQDLGCPTPTPITQVPAGKIAFLLPEFSNSRYETQDLPNFEAELSGKGFDVANKLIYNAANQDASVQQQQAEAAITNGAKVLVLDPVDSAAAAAIADAAAQQNVPVISYDRLITGTRNIKYYISFDNVQVGKLQATALMSALSNVTKPTIVMIDGSPTDHNAKLLKQGAHSVFDPLVTAGKLTIAKEYDTPNWLPDQAQTEMAQALTALNNKVDGVYAANDGTAGGAFAAMKAAGITTFPPMTGEDAQIDAIQRILTGEQYMTVYKAIKPEAAAAAQLAYDLATGTAVPSITMTGTTNNGSIDVPSIILTPFAMTKDNIETTVIIDGFWKVSDICTPDFAAACAAAGIK